MGRAPCCDKANVKRGPWSPEEDAKLKSYIEQHGTGGNWIALPHKIGLNRCGKSCRLRWLNYLRPNIKHGGFTEEEDRIICSLYISIGSRWSIIAAQLPGRTDNDIKNYWNTRLKKKLLGGRRRDQQPSLQLRKVAAGRDISEDGSSSQTLLNASAIDRLRLHMQLQGLHSPFSFYNVSTAIWPKLSSHENNVYMQTLNTDAIATSVSPMSTKHPQQADMCNNPMTANMQETIDLKNSSTFSNDEQLHDLLYGYKENQAPDCFKEMNDGEGMGWWESNINGFEDQKSSSSSWDSAMGLQLQEYGVGYDHLY